MRLSTGMIDICPIAREYRVTCINITIFSCLQLRPFHDDPSLFKRYLIRPVKSGDPDAMLKIRTLMKTVALRREKKGIVDFELPPKIEVNVEVTLS